MTASKEKRRQLCAARGERVGREMMCGTRRGCRAVGEEGEREERMEGAKRRERNAQPTGGEKWTCGRSGPE